jgi:ribosome maturation protein Sdo1
MNINKIVKDSVNGIKDKYNSTQINPFKMPENINVTITVDYEKSIGNLLKAVGKIKQEDMDNFAKLGKLVETTMKMALK